MNDKKLFEPESVVAQRQPKTDRLILQQFLDSAVRDKQLDEAAMKDAHAVFSNARQ